jgi:hypothetical protein
MSPVFEFTYLGDEFGAHGTYDPNGQFLVAKKGRMFRSPSQPEDPMHIEKRLRANNEAHLKEQLDQKYPGMTNFHRKLDTP